MTREGKMLSGSFPDFFPDSLQSSGQVASPTLRGDNFVCTGVHAGATKQNIKF
jgi:hypothetical protein